MAGIPLKRSFLFIVLGSFVLLGGGLLLAGVTLASGVGGLLDLLNRDSAYRITFVVGGAAAGLVGFLLVYMGMGSIKARVDRALEVERTRAETQARVLESRFPPQPPPPGPPPFRP